MSNSSSCLLDFSSLTHKAKIAVYFFRKRIERQKLLIEEKEAIKSRLLAAEPFLSEEQKHQVLNLSKGLQIHYAWLRKFQARYLEALDGKEDLTY